jgi:tripartite-type tricarboxylate transporter receptor subunit TctC
LSQYSSRSRWHGVVAPAGTPPATVERIATALQAVLAREPVQARLRAIGMDAAADSSPDTFRTLIESELVRRAAVVREAGLRAD